MNITRTDIDALNAKLTLVIEQPDYEEKVLKELKDIRRKANFPGFRPGMVPMGRVKQQYGKAVLADVINNLINEGIYDYIKQENLKILAEPLPNEADSPEINWDVDTTYTFAFDIALAPEFDAKLSGKNKVPYYNIIITDEMINSQIDMHANRFGQSVEVEDYQDNDIVICKAVENKEGGLVVDDVQLMPSYIQDEEQKHLFDGKKIGDVVTLNLTKAYTNDYERASMLKLKKEELSGLADEFTFTIEKFSRFVKAEVNEDLYKKVYGEEVADEKSFREHIEAEIRERFASQETYQFGKDCKAAILKKMEKIEFPEEFLKRWVLSQKDENKLTEEQLETEFPKMLEDLKWMLAKEQLVEAYKVKVEKEEIDAYALKMVKAQLTSYGYSAAMPDDMYKPFVEQVLQDKNNLRGIIEQVTEEKIYAALKDVVKLDSKEISVEDFYKLNQPEK